MDNQTFRHLLQTAAELQRNGRMADAEAACLAALDMAPEHSVALHNLGALTAAAGQPERAIAFFDRAIAAAPRYASAHYNRAIALQSVGQLPAAAQALSMACRIEPDFYEAHRSLGFLRLALGERDRALDHFARTYDLRRGESRIGLANVSLTSTNQAKLRHDAAQFAYLSNLPRSEVKFNRKATAYETLADRWSKTIKALTKSEFDLIGDDYNSPIASVAAPELKGPAVTPRPDHTRVASGFHRQGGMVVVDSLLTEPALASLRRYLLETTLWHDFRHIDDFVASYLEDGLACPLFLQIAGEMRTVFPELLGDLMLTQAWAFKALSSRASVGAHADDAAISVNFWVTPDNANRRPGGGGLAICLTRPNETTSISDYRQDEANASAFIDAHPAQTHRVPYACNRAVLFKSDLFHRSDEPDFQPDYESMRINVTLLFGRR